MNQILYGPPGTGKTYKTLNHALAILENDKRYLEDEDYKREHLRLQFDEYKKKRQVRFVTFHPSFTYEDFVEGIKPDLTSRDDGESTDVSYVIEDGIFKEICNSASETKKLKSNKVGSEAEKRFVLIIDEINRGNVPSIFGELITLLEPDKRTDGSEPTSVTLPYSKKLFDVPSNLYVIGTMNTADRSVEALDIALRRRFNFVPTYPEPLKISQPDEFDVKLNEMLRVINDRIEYLLDKDHTIGHSYFMDITKSENPELELKKIFANEVLPLLEEYFYGQPDKIGLVLGEDFVKVKSDASHTNNLFAKNFRSQDPPADRIVYTLEDPMAFDSIEPFKKIYE